VSATRQASAVTSPERARLVGEAMRLALELAVAVLLVTLGILESGVASVRAERVVRSPSVARECRRASSWDKLKPCLQRFGKVTIERSAAAAKLVRVDAGPSGWPIPGLYIYAQKGSALEIAGQWQFDSLAEVEVLGLTTLKVGGRVGFRLDVGTGEATSVSFDGETSVSAMMVSKTAVFCVGPGALCSPAIQTCDILVDGKAYYTFRGTLTVQRGVVMVRGDRSRAGACAPPERTSLAFDLLD
jgi:hypothetical protein